VQQGVAIPIGENMNAKGTNFLGEEGPQEIFEIGISEMLFPTCPLNYVHTFSK